MAGRVSRYQQEYEAALKQKRDEASAKSVKEFIRQLQEKGQTKAGLKPLQARGDITAKKKIGKRVTGGLSTEIRTLLSSDGIFSMDYEHVLGVN